MSPPAAPPSPLFAFLNGPELPAPLEWLLGLPNDASAYLPLVAVGAVVALVFGGARWRRTVALAALAVALCDPLNHLVVKELFAAPRPCAVHSDVVLRAGRCPASYSFPSSHAANVAAAGAVVAIRHPASAPVAVGLVGLAGLARIRAGVHGPADVAAGALLGLALGGGLLAQLRARRGPSRPGGARRWAALAAIGGITAATAALAAWQPDALPSRPREELARLASGEPAARLQAAVWLRRNRDRIPAEERGRLVAALDDPEPAVRFHAAAAIAGLVQSGFDAPVEALEAKLDDPVVGVRKASAWALHRMRRDRGS